jgi:hypothetical protein
MKTLLKQFTVLLGLATCILVNLSRPASADSTAALILLLRCQDDYTIDIWRRYASGEPLYRSVGPLGKLALGKGSRENAGTAQIYKFKNGDYVYQVVSGRGDHRWQGALEVFKNGRSILNQTCKQEA